MMKNIIEYMHVELLGCNSGVIFQLGLVYTKQRWLYYTYHPCQRHAGMNK
jgi:hypothetical protein